MPHVTAGISAESAPASNFTLALPDCGGCAAAYAQAATEISVDSIVMDCEDGVALNMKDVARGGKQQQQQ